MDVSYIQALVLSAFLVLLPVLGVAGWNIQGACGEALNPLEKLVGPQFSRLTDCEKLMLRDAQKGAVAYCGPAHTDKDPVPAVGGAPGTLSYDVHAELLRWLVVNPDTVKLVAPHGIQLFGARLVDGLNLSFVKVPFPLICLNCRFLKEADFSYSQLPLLDLDGSQAQGIMGDGLITRGDIDLRGSSINGEVQMVGAEIGGDLDGHNGVFCNPGQTALAADRIRVNGSVFLGGSWVDGDVRLLGPTSAAISTPTAALLTTLANRRTRRERLERPCMPTEFTLRTSSPKRLGQWPCTAAWSRDRRRFGWQPQTWRQGQHLL